MTPEHGIADIPEGFLSYGEGLTFSDVPANHPYRESIQDLADHGIINGYPNGTFRPDNPLSRQQFAKMIVLALWLPVSQDDECPFADVEKTSSAALYPDHYVAVCAARGITTGKTPTTFDPVGRLTRQQLISMVVRAAGLPDPPADFVPGFSPEQFYPETHYANARKAEYAGLLTSLQGLGPAYPTYDFMAPATRGECAQVLHNLTGLVKPAAAWGAVNTCMASGTPLSE